MTPARLVCLVSLLAATDLPAADYKAGVATKVITPAEPVWMAGYASRTKPAEGKAHDLYAKAVVIEDAAGYRLAFLTTDLIGLPRPLSEAVTDDVARATGLKREQLLLTSSHTHCGPVVRDNLADMYDMPAEQVRKIAAYTAKLKGDLVAVIVAAGRDLKPAKLAVGEGHAGFAVNRRQKGDKGFSIGTNPGGPVDHRVPLLTIRTGADDRLAAVVFGYACHNTTLDYLKWSGDYAGYAQIEIEKRHPGTVALFWSGCGADANPNPRRTQELAEKHGKELAAGVEKALGGSMAGVTGKLAARWKTIPIKYDTLPTREKLQADALSKTFAVRKRAERLLRMLDAGGSLPTQYDHYPVQVWKLGDRVLWVALGGEVVVDYAIRLRKELADAGTLWAAGYANDVMAYVPSERVLKEGGYEADSSMIYYGHPTRWAPGLEDAIVGTVKELAAAVRPPAAPKAGGGGKPLTAAIGPLSPKEEQATFRLPKGFRIELVAAEPDVVDPVAMCFDERGRLFVCEMRGYPNGGVGTGTETRGRVRALTDRDGDGVYEMAVTFADGLRFPMGVTPWRNGVIVAVAPDILHLEDTDGDGRADRTTVLYAGFNLANIQQMVNSLQRAADNWVYGLAGNNGGTVRPAQVPGAPAVTLQGRGFRFRPGVPGSLEPTSGGGQYGLTADDAGHWFTATNSQHLRQIVLPDRYLRRNPFLTVPAVTADVPDHGAACRVFRVSPFEPWRVERTTRRAGGTDARRFPATELVPGGFATSACSPLVYTADLFPPAYRGSVFVCDPANNLVHRDVLDPAGAAFVARRGEAECEFLASTDNWFRPTQLAIGPDGAVYVLDFYREAIETPLSLPDDIKARLNLESRGRGRIWRVVPDAGRPAAVSFHPDRPVEWTAALAHANSWVRGTAQRLIVDGRHTGLTVAVESLFPQVRGTPAVPNILGTLAGLGRLSDGAILAALSDPLPGNRVVGLRWAEPRLAASPPLRAAAVKLADDPTPQVRFQFALSAGAADAPEFQAALGGLLVRDAADPWLQTAVLCSSPGRGAELASALAAGPLTPPLRATLTRAAAMAAAEGKKADLTALLTVAGNQPARAAEATPAILEGMGQGMKGGRRALAELLVKPPAEAATAAAELRKRLEAAARDALDGSAPDADRLAAVRLLAFAPFQAAKAAATLLGPQTSSDLQLAAVRSVAAHTDPAVASLLLEPWPSLGPAARREVTEQLLARPDRIHALLDAIERKAVKPADLDPVRQHQLRTHPNAEIRGRSVQLFAVADAGDKSALVGGYRAALASAGDAGRGRAVYKANCASCHRLDNEGHAVGPDLLAVVPGKSGDDLLLSVLDPNREVDPRYVNYLVSTLDGRTLTGVIVAETPTGVSLRRADGAEETVRRADIESLRSTGLSLMPEGLEKQVSGRQMADLFAYLKAATAPKK